MKISAINTVQKNGNFIQSKKQNDKEPCIIDSIYQNEKLLKAGLTGLAIIGSAAIGFNILKSQGKDPIKIVKNTYSKIHNFLSEKPKPDPIIQRIGDKRDAEAVRLYKALIAEKKMNSLHKKLLAGHFDGKSKDVFESLRKNEVKLRRDAIIVL
ncbi:TPA: hypothetical protein IAA87_02200 [Candidatus Avigastranaerophilus faecigallinarum]|nr:hypothetical protein [Candidatus Avigastranaerophilus faecigallinarum]